MLVWDGHSCPSLLGLGLRLGLSLDPGTLSSNLDTKGKIKPKFKSVGQECPTHTS